MKLERRLKLSHAQSPKGILTKRRKNEPKVTFIILGSGKNFHKTLPYSKDISYTAEASEKITYKIDPDNLMIIKPFFGKGRLVAIFKHDGTPVKVTKSDNKVTAEILDLASRSTALSRTIKEMFTTHLNMKKVLFFVAIGVIGVVAYLILSGGIKI